MQRAGTICAGVLWGLSEMGDGNHRTWVRDGRRPASSEWGLWGRGRRPSCVNSTGWGVGGGGWGAERASQRQGQVCKSGSQRAAWELPKP